jgi:hypothetical protein
MIVNDESESSVGVSIFDIFAIAIEKTLQISTNIDRHNLKNTPAE